MDVGDCSDAGGLPEGVQTNDKQERTGEHPVTDRPFEAGEQWYLQHFNRHAEYLHQHRYGAVTEGHQSLEDRKDGENATNLAVLPSNSTWTAFEKDVFFGSLARHSRLRPDLIAAEVQTKTEAEVVWYLETLRAMSISLHHDHVPSRTRRHARPWQEGLAPPARQVSEDFVAEEERLAKLVMQREKEWSRQGTIAQREVEMKTAAARQKNARRSKKLRQQEYEQSQLGQQTNQVVELEQRNFVEDFLSDMDKEKMVYLSKRFDVMQKEELRTNASQALADARLRLRTSMPQPSSPQQGTQSLHAPHPTQRNGELDPAVGAAAELPSNGVPGEKTATDAAQVAFEEGWAEFEELPQKEREKLELEWQEEQRRADLQRRKKWQRTLEEQHQYETLSRRIDTRTKRRQKNAENLGITVEPGTPASRMKFLILSHQQKPKDDASAQHLQAQRNKPKTGGRSIATPNRAPKPDVAIANLRAVRQEQEHLADEVIANGNQLPASLDVAKQYKAASERAVTLGIDLFDTSKLADIMLRREEASTNLDADVLRWLRQELTLYVQQIMLRAIHLKEQEKMRSDGKDPESDDVQPSHVWRASGLTHHSLPAHEAASMYRNLPPLLPSEQKLGMQAWLDCPETTDMSEWTPYKALQDLEGTSPQPLRQAMSPSQDDLSSDSADYTADEDFQENEDLAELEDLQDLIDEAEDRDYERELCGQLYGDGEDEIALSAFDWSIYDRIAGADSATSENEPQNDEEGDGLGEKTDEMNDHDFNDNKNDDDDGKDDGGDMAYEETGDDRSRPSSVTDVADAGVAAEASWLQETKRDYIDKLYKFHRRKWSKGFDIKNRARQYRKPAPRWQRQAFRSAGMAPSDVDEDEDQVMEA